MEIYLPIAEVSVNVFTILFIGLLSGVLAGIFGVGGGFLSTPLLIFMGIAPQYAVTSSATQAIASSFSGYSNYKRRDLVDTKLGNLLIFGGFIGAFAGIKFFVALQKTGNINLIINIFYIIFLGVIGSIMFIESLSSILKKKKDSNTLNLNKFLTKLPWLVDFPKSKITLSIYPPLLISVFSGILVAIMGIGGGFILVPAMIYIFGMPTTTAIGTSLYQIIFITALTTILQAVKGHNLDLMLSVLLIIGSSVGAQIGVRFASKLSAEKLRIFLAVLLLTLLLTLLYRTMSAPEVLYEVIFQ